METEKDCTGAWTADEIVTETFSVIGVLLIVLVGYVSIRRQVVDEKCEMHHVLEILYFTAIIASCIILIGSIVSLFICKAFSQRAQIMILVASVHGGYIIILSALSGTLIIRLYITFRDSRWSISKTKVTVSLLTLLICDILICGAGVAWYLEWIEVQQLYLFDFIGLIIHILISIWAVCCFTANLISMAKIRAATKLELQLQPDLSARPQEMIGISSKYVALFTLAASTTVITFLISAYFRMVLRIHPGTTWPIDCVVNTVCLYLYHSFAADHYDRYCSGLDRCCRWKMINKVKHDFVSRQKAISTTIVKNIVPYESKSSC